MQRVDPAVVLFLVGAGLLGAMALATVWVKRPWNALPESVVAELATLPQSRPRYQQHRVDLVTANGKVVQNVLVAWGRYPSISPSRALWPHRWFRSKDVVDVVLR